MMRITIAEIDDAAEAIARAETLNSYSSVLHEAIAAYLNALVETGKAKMATGLATYTGEWEIVDSIGVPGPGEFFPCLIIRLGGIIKEPKQTVFDDPEEGDF